MARSAKRQAPGSALSISSGSQSLGDSGSWNTFEISVGTPPVTFQLLPSTSTFGIWLVHPSGCDVLQNTNSDCADSRGQTFRVDVTDGNATAASSSYNSTTPSRYLQEYGGFGLPYSSTESSIGYSGNGLSGTDNVTLGLGGSGPTLEDQTIFSYLVNLPWVGQLGLQNTSYTTDNITFYPSVLQSLKDNNFIPSHSYGYTSALRGQVGSLTLGGYDQLRAGTENVPIPLASSGDLMLSVSSITATNSSNNTLLTPSGAINIVIDSMVPEIWLPQSICTMFERAFGLIYDQSTDLYTLTSDQTNALRRWNLSVTFTVGAPTPNNQTLDITLPYAAFDQVATIPYINTTLSTNFFPLRRATDPSKYVLGRTFLQSAYLVTDFDNSQFRLSQAMYPDDPTQKQLMPITLSGEGTPTGSSPGASSSASSSSSGGGSNAGAIAGGVVGGVLGAAVIILLLYFCWYRPRQRKDAQTANEGDGESPQPNSDHREESDQNGASEGLLPRASEEKRRIAAHSAANTHEMDSPATPHGADVHEMYVQPAEMQDTSQKPEVAATTEEPSETTEVMETTEMTDTSSPTTTTTETQHTDESSTVHETHTDATTTAHSSQT